MGGKGTGKPPRTDGKHLKSSVPQGNLPIVGCAGRPHDERITLSLTNLALRSAAIKLESIVASLRDMTEAQLVEAFKLQLSDPTFGENGGAGLGLLQIARKMKGNITTRIEATDQEHCRCHCEISATLTPAQAA